MRDLRERIQSKRLMLMDGAMGSELRRGGLAPHACFEALNLSQPERVAAVHRAYAAAGAECLLTNTFQANPQALARHGLAENLESINRQAVQIARSAIGTNGYVIASIGAMDVGYGAEDLKTTLRSLSEADGWLLETWSDDFETALQTALEPAVNRDNIPVLISLSYTRIAGANPQPHLHPGGTTPAAVAERAGKYPIAALGVNCGREIGHKEIVAVLEHYRKHTDLPLLARPNAGTPIKRGDQLIYPHTPEQMASWLPDFISSSATLIGGCCGTTPAHVAAFVERAKSER